MFFMPNEPPTLAVRIRTFSFGTFRILREDRLVAGDALGRNLDGVALARLVIGAERRARFHRDHGDAGVDDIEFRHMRGGSERRLDLGGVADSDSRAPHCWGCDRRAAARPVCAASIGIGHGGQRFDVEFDGFGGVARLRQGLGDHESHGIADKAHLVGYQRGRLVCNSGVPSRLFSGSAAGDRDCNWPPRGRRR